MVMKLLEVLLSICLVRCFHKFLIKEKHAKCMESDFLQVLQLADMVI